MALQENNEDLQSQHVELKRTNSANKEQISRLMKKKAPWQDKYIQLVAKKPREEGADPEPAKRAVADRPDPAPAPSEDTEMVSSDNDHDATHEPDASNALNVPYKSNALSVPDKSNALSVPDTSNTLYVSNTSNTSFVPLPPPPWGQRSPLAEINDRRKEKFKRDMDLDVDPCGAGLIIEDEAEVILKMWKAEVRRSSRYVPDYQDDKLNRHRITHDGNIKVGVKTRDDFNRSTTTWGYHQKVEEQHVGFIKFQQRNYIPRVVSNYWRILNDPPLAAFERCIPVSLYYWEICRDSPDYIYPGQHISSGTSRDNSTHIKTSRNNSSHIRTSRDNSSHIRTPIDDTSRHKLSRSNSTNHKSSYHKSSSSARHGSSTRNKSAWHVATGAEWQTSLRASQEVEQDFATLVSWSNERISDEDPQHSHCPNLMSLDDITEINHLTDLIDSIRRENPPSYYIALLGLKLKSVAFAASWCIAQVHPLRKRSTLRTGEATSWRVSSTQIKSNLSERESTTSEALH
jgi:hypothetical protein